MSTFRSLSALTFCARCGLVVDSTWRAKVTHSATCDEDFHARAAQRRALIRARDFRASDPGVSARNCLRIALPTGTIEASETAPSVTSKPPLNTPIWTEHLDVNTRATTLGLSSLSGDVA